MELPVGKYKTIVADPPWNIKAGPGFKGNKSRPLPYKTMPVADIKAMGVKDLAEEDSHLYLWTINKYLPKAYEVAKCWGFSPVTLLVWAKTPMGGGLGGAYGSTTEFCLFARRGKEIAKQRHNTRVSISRSLP